MYDIIFIGSSGKQFDKLKQKYPTAKLAADIKAAKTMCFTKFFWVVWPDIDISDKFVFDYKVDDYSSDYIHVFLNGEHRDGVILVPKRAEISERELRHRFFINKKEVDVIASTPKPFDLYYVDTWEEYEHALENSSTEMFWAVSRNLTYDQSYINNFYFSHHNSYDRKENHAFVHEVDKNKLYNGVFLCSKNKPLNKKQIDYRFLVNAKRWEDIVSGPRQYEICAVDSYEDYLSCLDNVETEMFWMIPPHVQVNDDFKFDMYFSHDNEYDRKINHVFKNGKHYDGIVLCSKQAPISKREFKYSFIANKKEVDVIASTPKSYDIVFISYNEPNADENYTRLLRRFPRAKRIHGVKGIHQAHIEAAKLCTTPMFWVVDGDAQVLDTFNFEYQVPMWQKDNVFVWRSRNPINDLEYGYGGVKLFPVKETIEMDITKTDMTTSISTKFNAMPEVSNVTAFDTGAFETWKSAFRECCKLASKTIRGQVDNETEQRLKVWCEEGMGTTFGRYAISGACSGRDFGYDNRNSPDKLNLINDFDWLYEQFQQHTVE